VKVDVRNLEPAKWRYYRRAFDAETAGNDENDRLRLVTSRAIENESGISESFELPGYGMTFISIKRF
jgi:hypothetical protein